MRIRTFLLSAAALAAGAILAAAPASASTDKRVALVVGNSAYQSAVRLPNPERDAKAIADKLRKLGFIVVEGYNLDHDAMEETVKDFSTAVRGADIGLFFYAGHGMQVNGQNYLVPVDATFKDISALDFEAIPMDLISKQMQYDVDVRLVVLDACRDNPLAKTLSRSMAGTTRSNAVTEGLAEVKIGDAGEGTAIIFATSPDEVALDGDGEHSPFTTALLENIDAPDTDLQVVMSRVTGAVYASTKQQQRPWINASLTGEVYLNPQAKAAAAATEASPTIAAPAQPADSLERDTALYNLARQSGAREDYEAYLETFPNGLYANNARKQLERLDNATGQQPRVAAVAPTPETATPPPSADPARSVASPVVDLPVTDAVRAMPASKETEDELEFDRAKRAEIQTRLKLAGFLQGGADGSFGPKSRGAIGAWQVSRGLNQSGFFNQPQYEIFMQQTQAAFAANEPTQPSASSGGKQEVKQKNAGRKQVVRKTERRKVRQGNNAERVGRFLGGVVRGALGN